MKFLIALLGMLLLSACGSKTLTGVPNWCSIGKDSMLPKEINSETVYSFNNESRWFNYNSKVHGYPKSIYALPTSYNGAQLDFYVKKDKKDPDALVFELILKNSDKADIFREVDPIYNNLLPFLFSVHSDYKAVKFKESSLRKHKKGTLTRILPKGGDKVWKFKVSNSSLVGLTGSGGSQTIHLVACFGERVHTAYQKDNLIRTVPAPPELNLLNLRIVPKKIIRSNEMILNWDGDEWKSIRGSSN